MGRRFLRRTTTRLLMLTVALEAGCAGGRTGVLQYSVRSMGERNPENVLVAAETALETLGLSVARRNVILGELVTVPFDDATRIDAGARPRPPGPYAHRRRVATVRLEERPQDGGVRVFCRVEVQEQTTQALRMLSIDQGPSDVPDETAIQREAATTSERTTVWQTIRRDFAAERAILDAIARSLGE